MERQLSTSATMPGMKKSGHVHSVYDIYEIYEIYIYDLYIYIGAWLILSTMKNPYTKFGSLVQQPKMKPRRGDFIDRWEGMSCPISVFGPALNYQARKP